MRGLKCLFSAFAAFCQRSHPTRGAWIEIFPIGWRNTPLWSHPTRGAWIEILKSKSKKINRISRTPRGVRGLKFALSEQCGALFRSHPTRGAWIEINQSGGNMPPCRSRTPRGVRGLKCLSYSCHRAVPESHPTRGAWIEIRRPPDTRRRPVVAPHAGCVD